MRLNDAADLLGVSIRASREDAQKAYRKAALKHHPDRNRDDPDATSKFQTIGEAWERLQHYYDNPKRWGAHADPDEAPSDRNSPPQQYSYRSWDDLFQQWFSGARRSDFEHFSERQRRHKMNCRCADCETDRRREEIFAERQKAREARRHEAERLMKAAQARAKEEAARTMQERIAEAQAQESKREAAVAEAVVRRARALSTLLELLELPLVLPAPLDELLDAFAVLKSGVDKARRAMSVPDAFAHAGSRQRHDEETAAPAEAISAAAATRLLEQAERRLDALTEAVQAAAEEEEGSAAAGPHEPPLPEQPREGALELPPEPQPELQPRRVGSRKQRKASARNASLRAMQSLAAAQTFEELEQAMEEADGVRAGGSDLAFAIEDARERLERMGARMGHL
jgi:curved DNA-binding protein CbpA